MRMRIYLLKAVRGVPTRLRKLGQDVRHYDRIAAALATARLGSSRGILPGGGTHGDVLPRRGPPSGAKERTPTAASLAGPQRPRAHVVGSCPRLLHRSPNILLILAPGPSRTCARTSRARDCPFRTTISPSWTRSVGSDQAWIGDSAKGPRRTARRSSATRPGRRRCAGETPGRPGPPGCGGHRVLDRVVRGLPRRRVLVNALDQPQLLGERML